MLYIVTNDQRSGTNTIMLCYPDRAAVYVCTGCVSHKDKTKRMGGGSPSCASDVRRQPTEGRHTFLYSWTHYLLSHLCTQRRLMCFSNSHKEAINLQGSSKANELKNPLKDSYVLNLKWSLIQSVSTGKNNYNLRNFISPEDKFSRSYPHCHWIKQCGPPSFSKAIFTWTDLRWW